jgi:hypothetical protein
VLNRDNNIKSKNFLNAKSFLSIKRKRKKRMLLNFGRSKKIENVIYQEED